jgi:hypothetical protein
MHGRWKMPTAGPSLVLWRGKLQIPVLVSNTNFVYSKMRGVQWAALARFAV